MGNDLTFLGTLVITILIQEKNLGSPQEKSSIKRCNRILDLWRFIRPDLAITLTGILLYGLIGGTYPIIGAIMADVNAVCATF